LKGKRSKFKPLGECERDRGTLDEAVSLPRFSMKLFPSMSSWGHAAKLYVAAYVGVVVFTSVFWFFLLTVPIAIMARTAEFLPFFFTLAIGSLLLGFAFYQVIRFVYWLFLKMLWSKPPQSITPKGFRASLHSFCILTVASLPLAIGCYLPMLVDLYAEMQTTHQPVKPHALTPPIMMWFSWLWLIAAAYLYQWFPLQQRQQRASVKSA
jgi:hypothetical protein